MNLPPTPEKMKEYKDFIETASSLKGDRLNQRDLDDLIDLRSRQLDQQTNLLSRTVFANYQSFCFLFSFILSPFVLLIWSRLFFKCWLLHKLRQWTLMFLVFKNQFSKLDCICKMQMTKCVHGPLKSLQSFIENGSYWFACLYSFF